MRLHPEELALATAYAEKTQSEPLDDAQLTVIRHRSLELYRTFRAHLGMHRLINIAVIAFLLIADGVVLLWSPGLFLNGAWSGLLLAATVAGVLHAWLIYSMSVFSIHEGAAHGMVFPGRSRLDRALAFVGNQLGRLSGADPEHYKQSHLKHHNKFGTQDDGEFLNFVLPRRFWRSLLPYGLYLNHSDFVVHRDLQVTRSLVWSTAISFGYALVYIVLMTPRFGLLLPLLVMGVFLPHAGFYLDRLRQFTEHNHMPLENADGSRSLGLGFWGLLIGGGPWGQPCHWMHHLAPALPWYQQLRLHRFVVRLLSPAQREQHLIEPVVGFPKLLWRLCTDNPAGVSIPYLAEAERDCVQDCVPNHA